MQFLKFIFLIGLLFNFGCAEEAPVYKAQKVRVWTDHFSEDDGEFFSTFERKHRITVELTHLDAKTIEERLLKEKLNAPVDVLLLSNAVDIKRIYNQDLLYLPKEFEEYWSPLLIEPLVFCFPKDHDFEKYPLSGFKDWLEGDQWVCDTSKLSPTDYKTWLKGMKSLYGISADSLWKNQIFDPTQRLGYEKKVFQLQWMLDAQADSTSTYIIPNQKEGGALARTMTLAIVHNPFNTKAAVKFRNYCENPKWKRWLATRNKQWVYPLASRQPIQKKAIHVITP